MKLSEDDKIRDMASEMLDEYDKYLSEYSMILAFSVVLNPRQKLASLEFVYGKLISDTNIVKDKVSNVRKALNALLNEYIKKGASNSSFVSTSTDESKLDSIDLEYSKYLEEERQKRYAAGFTQLDLYLEEGCTREITALDYWKENVNEYDDLARLARDVLSIPIIAVASESPFSSGSCILNKYRSSCIISENLQALVCSHNWLHGFHPMFNLEI